MIPKTPGRDSYTQAPIPDPPASPDPKAEAQEAKNPDTDQKAQYARSALAILAELDRKPGSSTSELMTALGLARPTVNRHLDFLRSSKDIVTYDEARSTHHFLSHHNQTHIRLLPILRNPKKTKAIEALIRDPREWTLNRLTKETETHHTLIAALVKELKKNDLVSVNHRVAWYYVKAKTALADMLEKHRKSRWAKEARQAREAAEAQAKDPKTPQRSKTMD